ncbi:MAG: TonB-dependent receptor [Bacteroidales bacterium]|nr:TonB-dependent receptor [Bacteroidales bacterium]
MRFLTLLLAIYLSFLSGYGQTKYTISGTISDETGEELIGANIYIHNLKAGAVSNAFGFYSITLPSGEYTISYSYVGYNTHTIEVELNENRKININLEPGSREIESVEIRAERRDANVRKVEMSTEKLQMKTLKRLPVIFGETDVIKTISLLPGVQASNEASGGFHVRGGSIDQNLILLDDAPVYNASHAVGFFSVFNGDALKDVKLYKGGIPPEYGGRLSSILDIRMKDGNNDHINLEGGIGMISSRLSIDGPINKENGSFIIAGRRTYADLLLLFAKDSLAKQSALFFYDLNTKINYKINDRNRIFLSGYFGRDVVKLGSLLRQDYGNTTATLRWNHLFSDRLFSNLTLIYSNYNYDLGVSESMMSMDWKTNIIDVNVKLDLSYFINPNNTLKFGIGSIHHDFNPGKVSSLIDTVVYNYDVPNTYSWEHGFYIQNEQNITKNLSLFYGFRFSVFQNVGKSKYFLYDSSNPLRYEISDTINQGWGQVYNTYSGFEPRLALRYAFNDKSSVKASYNRMFQYIHLASNSTSSLPIDVWFPSSPNVKPQIADQVAFGYFRNFNNNLIETSVELYYKNNQNAIDFRDHAELILNDKYEGELRFGESWSYGAEFMIKKPEGRLNGWISYTYSRTLRKIPEINNGKTYSAPHDKPHDISVVLSYDINDKINVSANWVYSSAPPRTMPTGRFEYMGKVAPVYSDRNTIRIYDYHRMDLAVTLYGKKPQERKPRKDGKSRSKYESNWNFSLYNVYARHNPLTISFTESEDNPEITEASMIYLYSVVPSITYNFKF